MPKKSNTAKRQRTTSPGAALSSLTTEQVKRVAQLANLPLSDEELKNLTPQLAAIVGFISKLQKLDTRNVAPASQVTGLENICREDVVDPTRMFTQDQALANAKDKYNGFFRVPAIFD